MTIHRTNQEYRAAGNHTIGTNGLIGTNPTAIKPTLDKLFADNWKKGGIPELWDGKTAERIMEIIMNLFIINDVFKLKKTY